MNHQKMKSMTTLLLVFSIFTLPSFLTNTEAEYLYRFCPNTTTFTPNSTFQSNLNRLLSTLSSNANCSTGFYNATVQTPNNAVYGLFLCRGDVVDTVACKNCVATATAQAPERCPIEKQVVIWYDDCMLRYSDEPFFSTSAESPGFYLLNTQNVTTEQTRFNQVVAASMNEVTTEAANDAYKFATKQTNFSDQITLYSLGQCTQDLSTAVCDRCFREAIGRLPICCSGKQGGRVLFPSCNVRYEIYPFYAQNGTAPEPTPTEAVYLDEYCPDTTTFTPNSAFQSNLNRLLSTLSSNATFDTGFYNATASSSQSPYDTVYGLFLCRGDVDSTDDCKTCVATATSEAIQRCPNRKNVIIWYNDCMLRYSDESFFSRADDKPLKHVGNTEKGTANQIPFYDVLEVSVSDLAARASHESNKFATEKADVSESIFLYVLGQCTQDLSSGDCYWCLTKTIANVPTIQEGGQLLCPSCRLKIEVYRILLIPSPPPPLPPPPASIRARPKGRSRLSPYIIIVGSILAFIAVAVVLGYCFARRRAVRNNAPSQENGGDDTKTLESLQFDLGTIETATNKFSDNNKLGEGGFGVVFKGTLANEQEIAVKRLSKSSKQGVQEFKNEVALVAKLQHRNLVRLMGFCLEGEETILVYEYVPNQSLDYFLFESKKRERLDWSMRCMIIGGITRGIVYLHEDSRLRVIHRDLKASNILLDENMNPKISDFGMAKMFGVDDQTQGNTKRIVGTYGYMAPEYAVEGLYSIKSDVFSFGVLLLEIITGRKNFLGFHPTNGGPTLIGYAWKLWNEGKVLELMDPLLKGSCSPNEFLRYVHIGLLCVQEGANNRPIMSSVVIMLKSETISLSKPERPAFFTGRCIDHHDQVVVSAHNCSVNGLTISNVVAR